MQQEDFTFIFIIVSYLISCIIPFYLREESLFSARGRIARCDFFLQNLILNFASILLLAFNTFLLKLEQTNDFIYIFLLFFTIFLDCILLSKKTALYSKRLHDINITGYLSIPFNFFLFVKTTIYIPTLVDDTIVFKIIVIVCILFLIFKKGTEHSNKYGENPLADKNTDQ